MDNRFIVLRVNPEILNVYVNIFVLLVVIVFITACLYITYIWEECSP